MTFHIQLENQGMPQNMLLTTSNDFCLQLVNKIELRKIPFHESRQKSHVFKQRDFKLRGF